jgi:hypothetical protein
MADTPKITLDREQFTALAALIVEECAGNSPEGVALLAEAVFNDAVEALAAQPAELSLADECESMTYLAVRERLRKVLTEDLGDK